MKISLNISGVDQLKFVAAKIKQYPAQAAIAGMEAANDVAGEVITAASRDLTERYALPASYIREKFRLHRSVVIGKPAIVGARERGTRLARFNVEQLTVAAPRAKGDPSRGIAKGRKQAGVSVHVVRANGRKKMAKHFLIPLRAGKVDGGNGMGIFWRYGNEIEHEHGPSVHEAFRYWSRDKSPEIARLLARAFATRLSQQLRRSGK